MKEDDIRNLVMHRLDQAQTALDDARFLLEGGRSAQSIVNRAYYAMFYSVLALLQKSGKVPSKHTGAISLFDREFVAKGIFPKELSKSLHKSFELRQAFDYKTIKPVPAHKAEEILNSAVRFVTAIKDCLLKDIQK